MPRPTRLLLVLLAGLLLLGAVGALLWSLPPIPAGAQGVGIFGTAATGTRTNCNQITNPVVGQSACLDQSTNTWRVYTGASTSTTNWVSVANNATQTGVNNVRDFGAVGDGTTDDTTAIRAAIAQASADGTQRNKIVFFPPGYYKVTATVEVPPNTILRGTGRFSTNLSGSDLTASAIGCAFDGPCLRFVRRNTSAGNLWHMGGIEDMGFVPFDDFGGASTLASRFIELGDPNAVTTSTGAWTVFVRRCTFNDSSGGYGIYSAHSQDAFIEDNWFNGVKFPIYYNTVISTAKIIGNYFLDQSNIAGAIAMQFRPGTLGGSAGGPLILGNYTLGFQYAVWNTSIIGMTIRDNVFETTYQTPLYLSAFLSDQVTQDGAGPTGTVIDGNTFIGWGQAATNVPAIQLNYSQNGWIGVQSYQSPNAAVVTAMINWFDGGAACSASPGCTGSNVIVEPKCTGSNCTGLAPFALNATSLQNTLLGRNFIQQQAQLAAAPSGLNAGAAGRMWWDNSTKALKYFDGTSVFLYASQSALNINAGIQIGTTAGDPGSGALRVASAIDLNATRTLWNGSLTTGTPRCTNNCGLAPALVGTNSAMRVTMGATGVPATPFLVLFNGTWNQAPACVAQIDTPGTTAATVTRANASATGVSINTVVNPPNGAVYSILCLGVG